MRSSPESKDFNRYEYRPSPIGRSRNSIVLDAGTVSARPLQLYLAGKLHRVEAKTVRPMSRQDVSCCGLTHVNQGLLERSQTPDVGEVLRTTALINASRTRETLRFDPLMHLVMSPARGSREPTTRALGDLANIG